MAWWFFRKKKVGLALGGGVARGIAHIGVLKVLQQNQIPVDFVSGTSSGSLVGAAFAAGLDLDQIEQIVLRIHWQDFFKFTFFQPGFTSAEAIEDFAVKYLGDPKFSDLKIPFAVVTTDLRTGERVVINQGRVVRAVAASATFPGVFVPEERAGRFLVDGGIVSNVPVDLARELGAEFVIASDAVPSRTIRAVPQDAFQVLGRSLDLILKRLSQAEARRADVLIELEFEDEDIWHLDFHKAKKLIEAGMAAAHRQINKIRRGLRLSASN